jgi:hypothetical protein
MKGKKKMALTKRYGVKFINERGPATVFDQGTITVEMPFKLRDDVGGEASFSTRVIFKNEKGTMVLITPRAVARVKKKSSSIK